MKGKGEMTTFWLESKANRNPPPKAEVRYFFSPELDQIGKRERMKERKKERKKVSTLVCHLLPELTLQVRIPTGSDNLIDCLEFCRHVALQSLQLLADWFARKNSRRHRSIYNIYCYLQDSSSYNY